MSDLLERIRMAQVLAAEQAAIEGRNIHAARVHAGEQEVLKDLRSKESKERPYLRLVKP